VDPSCDLWVALCSILCGVYWKGGSAERGRIMWAESSIKNSVSKIPFAAVWERSTGQGRDGPVFFNDLNEAQVLMGIIKKKNTHPRHMKTHTTKTQNKCTCGGWLGGGGQKGTLYEGNVGELQGRGVSVISCGGVWLPRNLGRGGGFFCPKNPPPHLVPWKKKCECSGLTRMPNKNHHHNAP